jgi:hypothetical protein
MAILARPTHILGIVEMDEGEQITVLGNQALQVFLGLVTTSEHVTGVHAETESGIRKGLDESHKLLVGAEHLGALTGRSLQEKRALGGG